MLSFLSNTLSFMRIGAYAITHVGLMMVIQMLAGPIQEPLVLVLGNLFVMGFEVSGGHSGAPSGILRVVRPLLR